LLRRGRLRADPKHAAPDLADRSVINRDAHPDGKSHPDGDADRSC
jgi:hypothetical protein